MDEQIKQIAERLRGLRDVLELTAEDIARVLVIHAFFLPEFYGFQISFPIVPGAKKFAPGVSPYLL